MQFPSEVRHTVLKCSVICACASGSLGARSALGIEPAIGVREPIARVFLLERELLDKMITKCCSEIFVKEFFKKKKS